MHACIHVDSFLCMYCMPINTTSSVFDHFIHTCLCGYRSAQDQRVHLDQHKDQQEGHPTCGGSSHFRSSVASCFIIVAYTMTIITIIIVIMILIPWLSWILSSSWMLLALVRFSMVHSFFFQLHLRAVRKGPPTSYLILAFYNGWPQARLYRFAVKELNLGCDKRDLHVYICTPNNKATIIGVYI